MDYIITALKDNCELLGSANASIIREAKTMRKVNNALKWFNPDRDFDEIRISSFTNIYNEDSYRVVRTIKKVRHAKPN